MRSRYKDQSGTETFYNEVDTAFSGQDAGNDEESGFTDGNAGMGTTSQSGANPAVLNPVGSASTRGYNTGQGMVTGDSENLSGTGNDAFNQMAFSFE